MKKINLKLKRVEVLDWAIISAIFYAIISLIVAIPFSLILSVTSKWIPNFSGIRFSPGFFSFLMIPIIYGVLGLIFGAFTAFIFNITLKITNGFTFTVETENDMLIDNTKECV